MGLVDLLLEDLLKALSGVVVEVGLGVLMDFQVAGIHLIEGFVDWFEDEFGLMLAVDGFLRE